MGPYRRMLLELSGKLPVAVAVVQTVTIAVPPVAAPVPPAQPPAQHWQAALQWLTGKQLGLKRRDAQNLVIRVQELQPDLADVTAVVQAALRLRR